MKGPRGRYAPSPTGEIHLGNASSALLAWLSIRSRQGSFVMRIEDLDQGRVRPGLAGRILHDLDWLGIDWDEGPDCGGPFGPYEQSSRSERYREAFERLDGQGSLYPCFCSRKDIAAAASAPQEPGEERRYPGTCLGLDPAEARRRIAAGRRHAWRFRVESTESAGFVDRIHGHWRRPELPGDFVVLRSDGVPAYHLAVVVDDVAMEIDEVVRGDDLLSSTLQQRMLLRALGHRSPEYAHVPLLLGTDGARLSKRHAGTTLRELREDGFSPEKIVGGLAFTVGLQQRPRPLPARDLLEGFELGRLPRRAGGIVVDPGVWGANG